MFDNLSLYKNLSRLVGVIRLFYLIVYLLSMRKWSMRTIEANPKQKQCKKAKEV